MSAPLSPRELRIEISKCLSNARFDFLKRLADRQSIAKQYHDGNSDIHIHLLFGGRAWCANYISSGTGLIPLDNSFCHDVHESIMFVKVVKITKLSNPIRSIVRLKPFDHCHMFIADAPEVGISPELKNLMAAFNRELRSRWLSIGIEECKSVDEIVQSTAEIVANLPNKYCACGRSGDLGGLPDSRSYEEIVGRIGIKLGDESILVFLREGVEPTPQISKVFLCPRYTKEGAIKAVTGRDSLPAGA